MPRLILWPESGEEALYVPPREIPPAGAVRSGPGSGPGPEAAAGHLGFDRVESIQAPSWPTCSGPSATRGPDGGLGLATVVYLIEPTLAARLVRPPSGDRFARFVREGAPEGLAQGHRPDRSTSCARSSRRPRPPLLRRADRRHRRRPPRGGPPDRPGRPRVPARRGDPGGVRRGGRHLRAGFPSIVGSGPNSTVLHYNKNDRTIVDGDLVVVDIGGEFKGYTADITRTYPAERPVHPSPARGLSARPRGPVRRRRRLQARRQHDRQR